MTTKLDLAVNYIDSGFCRIYYRDKNTKRHYCVQDEGLGGRTEWVLNTVTPSDGYMEPESTVQWSRVAAIDDPIVKFPDDSLAQSLHTFIKEMRHTDEA